MQGFSMFVLSKMKTLKTLKTLEPSFQAFGTHRTPWSPSPNSAMRVPTQGRTKTWLTGGRRPEGTSSFSQNMGMDGR